MIKWRALGASPHPLEGNCSDDSDDFCRVQAGRHEAISVVSNPDPSRGPAKLFRYEVRFGDNVAGMSDCRSLSTGPGKLWVPSGTEEWWRWITRQPADWVGGYPKWDELYAWPSVKAGAGSGMEFHHAPLGGGIETGSAPLYTGANDDKLWLGVVGEATRTGIFRWEGPMKREFNHEWLLHIRHAPDMSGFIEMWVDGENVIPMKYLPTMFSNTQSYPVDGIYRNYNIGGEVDQNGNKQVWPQDADPNIAYPHGFVPKKNQLVYPNGDGAPGYQFIGGLVVGDTREDVISAYVVSPPVPPPEIGTPGLPPNAVEGLKLLIANKFTLEALIKVNTAQGVSLQKMHDEIVALLDKGPW